LAHVRIRLAEGDVGGDLNGHLLVADSRFQRRLIRRQQPIHERLLVVLGPANVRQGTTQLHVHPRTRVLKPHRLGLDAVHQDDPHARKGIVIQLADRNAHHIAPGEVLNPGDARVRAVCGYTRRPHAFPSD
jgi:hypothetical protein